MNKLLLLVLVMLYYNQSFSQRLTSEEEKLYQLIMEYRQQNGLPSIPRSPSLTIVAQTHSKDLADNNPVTRKCNMHSWSDQGRWTACCYTSDHARSECMWRKPGELTAYKGNGYEIAYNISGSGNPVADAARALQSWKGSPGHNSVILNLNVWKSLRWQAIGIGIYKGYAVVWFGEEVDKQKAQ